MSDAEFLFDKSYECPICDHSFKAKTVRTGKVRTESTDMDLRPRFKQVDCLKYEPVLCPKCGYAAMAKEYIGKTAVVYEADENGEDLLVTIDDDDEFEKAEDYFNDLFFSEIDYDAN